MLQTEINKLNARLQAAFNQKRLLAHSLAVPVKTDDGQLLYDATDNSKPVTLEDWPDAQVFYVAEDSNAEQFRPNQQRETFEVIAVIYTNLPDFRAFFQAHLQFLGFEYTGSRNNPIAVANSYLPGLTRWNHERELYALSFTITLPVKTSHCVNNCF